MMVPNSCLYDRTVTGDSLQECRAGLSTLFHSFNKLPTRVPGMQQTRPQRQRSTIPSFIFIAFMLFMLTSHNGDEFLARHQYQSDLICSG
jgi:hypothetical protein